jgi:hypothetical protein
MFARLADGRIYQMVHSYKVFFYISIVERLGSLARKFCTCNESVKFTNNDSF